MDDHEIRKATRNDLEQIRTWLHKDADDGYDSSPGMFQIIEAGQQNGSLTVLVDSKQHLAIAFALGNENLDLFGVKHDRRRVKIGTSLAMHWMQDAREREIIGFYGECAPASSLSFWESLGCQQVQSPSGNSKSIWVALPFRQKHSLLDALPKVPLTFEIHSANEYPLTEWNFTTLAAVVAFNDYMLSEDFVAYVPHYDAVLTIRENGSVLCQTKVKNVENIGGERSSPWVRIRGLVPS